MAVGSLHSLFSLVPFYCSLRRSCHCLATDIFLLRDLAGSEFCRHQTNLHLFLQKFFPDGTNGLYFGMLEKVIRYIEQICFHFISTYRTSYTFIDCTTGYLEGCSLLIKTQSYLTATFIQRIGLMRPTYCWNYRRLWWAESSLGASSNMGIIYENCLAVLVMPLPLHPSPPKTVRTVLMIRIGREDFDLKYIWGCTLNF